MSDERTRTYSWDDPLTHLEEGLQMVGIDYMQAIANGKFPQPPMAQTIGFALAEITEGRVVFECKPQEFHYNPLGVVHGGLAAILLDSAMGCAVHTTLPQGMGYTTVQYNVNLVRAITTKVKKLRSIATVIHSGRQTATAEAKLVDENEKIYAHATTTCLVFPLPNSK